MAIKVGGTTVIDDSRNISNVGGFKTINSTSILGSGNISAGASTTYAAVGTYVVGAPDNLNSYTAGSSTVSGSSLKTRTMTTGFYEQTSVFANNFDSNQLTSMSLSGTWKAMANSRPAQYQGTYRVPNLWMRIS